MIQGYQVVSDFSEEKVTFLPPQGEDVLIEVSAVGMNRADVLQQGGKYPPPPNAPYYGTYMTSQGSLPLTDPRQILGLEVAGKIIAIGPLVRDFEVGARVMALLTSGGYASHVYTNAHLCLPIPSHMSEAEASCFPEALFTLWNSVYGKPWIKRGERLLIHGGSSGIGVMAIQLAQLYEQEVFVTVKNKEKAAACKSLGAHHTIIYPESDFVKGILDLTSGRGVDVILDCVAGSYVRRNLNALSFGGRLLQLSVQCTELAQPSMRRIMSQQLLITGATLRDRTLEEKKGIAQHIQRDFYPHLLSKRLKSYIFKHYSFKELPEAFESLTSQQHIGKIVLYPNEK